MKMQTAKLINAFGCGVQATGMLVAALTHSLGLFVWCLVWLGFSGTVLLLLPDDPA